MPDNVAVVIPARYHSTRFDGKLLKTFRGKPVLWWDINSALKLKFKDNLVIATADDEIKNYVKDMPGVQVVDIDAPYGTAKVFSYYISINNRFDYYMSWPADEPAISPNEVNRIWSAVKELLDTKADVVTLWTKFYEESDLKSNLSCKLAVGRGNRVLYFSRAIIPSTKSGKELPLDKYKKHVGIFFFAKRTFQKYGPSYWWGLNSELQEIEGLEQNRFLDLGMQVYALEIKHIGFGIDTPDQIEKLEKRIAENEH